MITPPRCPKCSELPEYCPGHKPDEPPHIETCQMCANRKAARMTTGDPRTPTPDGHATCPRCEQKARTA